ncbi:MAG: diguanylate cyclase [Armatimonadota bacterium]
MFTLESLPLVRVWLDADQLASTARILMDGYRVPALGVVDSDRRLIGWVTQIELIGTTEQTTVAQIMVTAPEGISSSLTVREAAGELIKRDTDCLPVMKGNRFLSVVTSRSLLGKLRESYDPMTELPWSDALREWGIEQLERGVEIVILFIDLNDFGKFNKQYGHVVGDQVIQTVAAHLRSKIDSETDVLVRYGGDEFAIGTFRDRDDAEELMANILGDGKGLSVDKVDAPVTFTIGIYGGRRTKTRNDVHGASNLDNLVNLASRDCLSKKEGVLSSQTTVASLDELVEAHAATPVLVPSADVSAIAPPGTVVADALAADPEVVDAETIPVVETVQADDEPNSLTYVVIRAGDRQFVGTSVKMGHSKTESVAYATAKALEKAYESVKVTVDSVTVESAGSTDLVTVRVRTIKGNLERDVTAQAEANGDLEDTIGLAVISAFLAE